MSEPAQQPTPETNPWEPVFRQAVLFHGNGQLAEAASLFAAIVEHNPDHFPSLQRLASIRRQQGRPQESLSLLQRAISGNPDSAETHNSLGNTLIALGRTEEALEEYRSATALRANFPEAHFNLANTLKAVGRFDEAAIQYQTAIELRQGYADAHTNLAIVLGRLNRPSDALQHFVAALKSDSHSKLAYSNVAMALIDLNRHEEALPYLKRAREVEPDAPQAIFNEAIARLGMGDYESGWEAYEARLVLAEFKQHQLLKPLWDGKADISGKTILLHAEQGLGDSILFARFIELVVERGARVLLTVQKPLVHLMKSMPGVSAVFASDELLPEFDLHMSWGSLPRAFGITLSTIPRQVPYLHPPADSEAIKSLVRLDSRPLVGVCWAGNPNQMSDFKRSILLSRFEKLLRIAGIGFVSLQQNLKPGEDLILSRLANIDLEPIRNSKALADTAAIVSKLDLVITVDTAMAHLAGALGRAVWILQRFSANWIWMRDRTDSPWYPTARLFRQHQAGEWDSVLNDVAAALSQHRFGNC